MRRIYISGGITGVKNYREIFAEAEKELQYSYDNVVNPVKVGDNVKFSMDFKEEDKYQVYMREDLRALLNCTHIYMLKGWSTSKGSCFELDTAKICGLKIIYA